LRLLRKGDTGEGAARRLGLDNQSAGCSAVTVNTPLTKLKE
jgi:hypothetical protein